MENVRDRESLERWTARGGRPKYLFFWGHRPRRDGLVGAGCLSQWWPSPFTVDGVTYATAEHWMMAGKARLFGDAKAEARAIAASHPQVAKSAGREVRGFDEATWTEHRVGLVVRGNVAKFAQHDDLRAFLLGTNTRVLVEASPVDHVWGIGLAADDERAADPARWRGLNLLARHCEMQCPDAGAGPPAGAGGPGVVRLPAVSSRGGAARGSR